MRNKQDVKNIAIFGLPRSGKTLLETKIKIYNNATTKIIYTEVKQYPSILNPITINSYNEFQEQKAKLENLVLAQIWRTTESKLDDVKEKLNIKNIEELLELDENFMKESEYNKLILNQNYLINNSFDPTYLDHQIENIVNKIDPLRQKLIQTKRHNYISWEEYFLGLISISSDRSKDPSTQIGAIIVDDNNIIIGMGYNGFPKNCSDEEFPWISEHPDPLNKKDFYVAHAEKNAIDNSHGKNIKGAKLYVSLFPCHMCAQSIIQNEISEVIYLDQNIANKTYEDKDYVKASKKMLNSANIKLTPYNTHNKKFIISKIRN